MKCILGSKLKISIVLSTIQNWKIHSHPRFRPVQEAIVVLPAVIKVLRHGILFFASNEVLGGGMLNRLLLIIPLAIPLCGYSQGYADSPLYKIVSAAPSTAHALGRAPGVIANGIVIDISMLEPAPFTPQLTNAWVDRSTPEHIFSLLPPVRRTKCSLRI